MAEQQPSFASPSHHAMDEQVKAPEGQTQQIQVKASDGVLKGVYSNAMQVLHTKHEFVLDFMNMFPPAGTLNARIIVSPAHLKQMILVLQDNIGKYEASFGKVEASEVPSNTIGFQAK